MKKRKKFKVNRKKVSGADTAYNLFNLLWSKTFGKKSARMSKEEFLMDADMRGTNITDVNALNKAARQRVASAAHQLTTEQAKNLKKVLLNLADSDLQLLGLSRREIRKSPLEMFVGLPTTEKGQGMLSKFYELLKQQGLTVKEAREWISAEIYGS